MVRFAVLGEFLWRHSLRHLDHPLIQHVRLFDRQLEDIGPRLRADGQQITEPSSGDERASSTPALQQGISGHGGAHTDALDHGRVQRHPAGQIRALGQGKDAADAFDWGVGVVAGVFGEELEDDGIVVWDAGGDDVGECAAAIWAVVSSLVSVLILRDVYDLPIAMRMPFLIGMIVNRCLACW